MIICIVEMDDIGQVFLSDEILGTKYCLIKSNECEGKVDYLEMDNKNISVEGLMKMSRCFDIVINETDILLHPKRY